MTMFPPGEAQAVLAKAEAKAKAIRMLSDALREQVRSSFLCHYHDRDVSPVNVDIYLFIFVFLVQNGNAAASLSVAEQYVSAFSNLAKQSNTILLPTNTGDISGMVSQVCIHAYFLCRVLCSQQLASVRH